MKFLCTAVVATAAILPLVNSISIAPRSDSPRVVSLPIQRKDIPDIAQHERTRLRKRQNTVEQTLDNEQTLYYANLTLGTPAQALRLHIDTGSSDLWVNTDSSSLCQSRYNPCEGGTYQATDSSTANLVNREFNISYQDGSYAIGDYVSDTITFGGVTMQNFQFGIGQSSTSAQGVLGIGYAINEVQVGRAGLQPYPNLPLALVQDGHIASNAYSLWLNDLDANTGTILFGGVNTAKYQGDLATMPVLPTYGDYYELTVALTGMSIAGNSLSGSSNIPAGVLLDSGTSLCYLPDDIITEIYNEVGAVYSSEAGLAYAYCSLANSDSTVDFDFSGQVISVPYNELFLDAGTDRYGRPLTFDNGEQACVFGFAPAQGGTVILGDTFLRSAYVVYDLANNEISMAQTVFNATANDVREIGSGAGSVPGAVPVSSAVTNVAGATGGGYLGGATGTLTGGLSNPTGTTGEGAGVNLRVPVAFSTIGAFFVAMWMT